MVRLTCEMIDNAPQYINTIRDRELNLRGFKIPVIENMGVTRDQFDVIDLTDNDVKRLENFPLLKRLNTLYLHNNRVQIISPDIGEKLPNLKTIALTNNNLCELGDIDPLAELKKLEYVSFIGNPMVHKQNYREYIIFKLPTVRVIDFKRVRLAEREAARRVFKGKKGQKAREAIARTTVGQESEEKENAPRPNTAMSQEDKEKIQKAVANAKSIQEVEYLNSLLEAGKVPEKGWNKHMDLLQEQPEPVDENQFVPETETEEQEMEVGAPEGAAEEQTVEAEAAPAPAAEDTPAADATEDVAMEADA